MMMESTGQDVNSVFLGCENIHGVNYVVIEWGDSCEEDAQKEGIIQPEKPAMKRRAMTKRPLRIKTGYLQMSRLCFPVFHFTVTSPCHPLVE